MSRLILRIKTDSQVSVTVKDEAEFDAAFQRFKLEAPQSLPTEQNFLEALAHRHFRGEDVSGSGVSVYQQETSSPVTSSRFGDESLSFEEPETAAEMVSSVEDRLIERWDALPDGALARTEILCGDVAVGKYHSHVLLEKEGENSRFNFSSLVVEAQSKILDAQQLERKA